MFIRILLNSWAHPPKPHPFPEPSPTGNGVSIAGQPLRGSEVSISINGRLERNSGRGPSLSPMKMKIDSLRRKAPSRLPTERVHSVGRPTGLLFWGSCQAVLGKICLQKYINTKHSAKY